MQKIFIFICFIFAFVSCKKNSYEPVNYHKEYLPISIGTEHEYFVDSIVYDNFKKTIDTFSFVIKEVIEDTFTDKLGHFTYLSYVYWQDSITNNWIPYKTNLTSIIETRIERVENNKRFINLVFPPENGIYWKGNRYNDLPDWDYEYFKVHKKDTIGIFQLDSTLSVIQINEENFIQRLYSEERYAKGVGLYYKEWLNLETQSGVIGGLHLIYRLKSYKN